MASSLPGTSVGMQEGADLWEEVVRPHHNVIKLRCGTVADQLATEAWIKKILSQGEKEKVHAKPIPSEKMECLLEGLRGSGLNGFKKFVEILYELGRDKETLEELAKFLEAKAAGRDAVLQ